jgi:pimeloyl-ACP methyl ester carboxylesterase
VARRVVLCLPDGAPTSDPAPAETAKRDVELSFEWDGTAAGVVGFGEGGRHAVELAAANPELVDRLVLVSAEPTEGAPAFVDAKTLLIFGSLEGGRGKATWWKNRIGGRIEMVPREGREILGRLWTRVLSHLAPRSAR